VRRLRQGIGTNSSPDYGTYFIGFIGRLIGAGIFGHYGDRIGRKPTLIATLLCMASRPS
jgi:MFS family permease